ncbi:MAG: hydantoinase/oxoprolinase family protein [Chloroflexota bacterium]
MGGLRVGIDVGGTFTDVVAVESDSGRALVHKIPSTPSDPAEAIVRGLTEIAALTGQGLDHVEYFAHGSTVATNALLQRQGARVGLITTEGFRDLLEIGRQTRPHLYDLQVDKPPPLASRDLRLGVPERLQHDGTVLQPLDLAALRAALARLGRGGIESLAICFLHSYREPAHERAARDLAAELLPGVFLSVSHEVLPEFREFERLNTTVVNAFLGPGVGRYLRSLEDRLAQAGPACSPYMTQSNGGIVSLATAARFPFKTALSGPSSGVIAAGYIGQHVGRPNVVTFDMGGTSADFSLIADGRLSVASQREVGGYPVKTPMIDVHTIGAGGGSIAWVDPGGLLKVGPASAGADPGPACYGQGGTEATVTDAHVVLGTLNSGAILGGALTIDRAAAEEAVARIGRKIGLGTVETARGIVAVAVANMVRAIHVISVQRGRDPRDYTLMAFGGAGPLHAAWIARELGVREVLVPERPGLLCAYGLLVTDARADFVQTALQRADQPDLEAIAATVEGLERAGERWLDAEGFGRADRLLSRWVAMRYRGQNHELSVAMPPGPITAETVVAVVEGFYAEHERAYGYAVRGEPTELVTFRVEAVGLMPKAPLAAEPLGSEEPEAGATIGHRQVQFEGGAACVPVYSREGLRAGNRIDGPAIVEQLDATTVLLPEQTARVDGYRNLLIAERAGGQA